MAFTTIPLSEEVLTAVRDGWGIEAEGGVRLHGGGESAAYRLGHRVVRIGPEWRTDAELNWAYAVAAHAAASVPEALAPLPDIHGSTVVRVDGRPVSVWPYAAGHRPDRSDRRFPRQAAHLLARLHRALGAARLPPRPRNGMVPPAAPDLDDPDLDDWLAGFARRHPVHQPLHGDFYDGNMLVQQDRITALLDWDEALLGPPERELAEAAWEWGQGLQTLRVEGALDFISWYVAACGPVARLGEKEVRQLVRDRIRREVRYNRTAWQAGWTEPESEHEALQVRAFHVLRP